jgi:hypothetical protein
MKSGNALRASLERWSVRLPWKAVVLALFACAALTAAGCDFGGAGPFEVDVPQQVSGGF